MAANNDFHGFQVSAINRNALMQLHEEEPQFWETSVLQGAAMVQSLNLLGRALRLSYSNNTWRQLTDAQLETIVTGYETAADFILPVSHYRRLGLAREVLARCPLEEALRGESRTLTNYTYRALLRDHLIDIDLDQPFSQVQD
ncbi:hypothetical protein M5689_012729 [Euphorbia peplus]|nr:hypothetical protein M5689_012729 [Euphorbia peplus]